MAPDPFEDAIVAEVEARETYLVDLCRRLVEAPSVSPPGDTRAVATVVADALADLGRSAEVVARDPLKPSVLATVGEGRPHLVLNVHLDTMPPGDVGAWTVDPFRLTEREGRLYGLGMGNMKGAVAAMVVAYAILAERVDALGGRITFSAVADEVMFGPDGAAWLLESRPDDLVGDGFLCGEGPGFMRVAVGEKGVAWYLLEAEGPAGHSSRARAGASAIAKLAAAVLALDAANGRDGALPGDLREVPTEGDPGATLAVNVGTIEGGTVESQLPTRASATADLRLPPGIDLAAADALVADACDPHDVRWSRVKGWDPNWTGFDERLTRSILGAVRSVRGTPAVPAIRVPASDASRWRALGVPAICFGPQPTHAAGIDDYAERVDVVDCAKIYALTAARFLGGTGSDR